MKEYIKIGSSAQIDGTYYFNLEYCENGSCFKDGEAYAKYYDKPCYVGESAQESDDTNFDRMEDYYTHRQLLDLCFGNHDMCDALFTAIDWQSPEIWIDELEAEDIEYFYGFVKKGNKVYWKDPDRGISGGVYEVYESPFDNEDPGLDFESTVLIGNEYSEAEVPLCELIKPSWAKRRR